MWAGANVDKAVRPRGELLLLIEQQKHELQRQKRELDGKQQEVDRQQQKLEAKQEEIDRLVAELKELEKRKREQDQGSDNITVASSQWRWREGSRRGRRGQGDLSVETGGTCPYSIPFKGNWNKRKWILPS